MAAPGQVVRLAGFLIGGGESPEGGGGVSVHAGQVELLECTLRFNKAPVNGGGGLLVTGDARVTATRCRFEGNTGRQGGAILVDELATLTLERNLLPAWCEVLQVDSPALASAREEFFPKGARDLAGRTRHGNTAPALGAFGLTK